MIRPIQYLRGVAAMMVVWYHSVGQIAETKNFIGIYEFGHYGVDLFFVISGFIMLVTTWDKPITPIAFIGHRIRRVVPLYWAATLAMVAAAIVAPGLFKTLHFDAASLAKSLFFIPYDSLSFPGTIFPLLTPGWTLDYEMFFYALFAASLWAPREWRVSLMVGALVALVAGGYLLHPASIPMQTYTSPRLLEFGAGMILGRLWVMRKHARQDGGNAVLMGLGDASYSIYLTHIFTLGALRMVWIRLVPQATMPSSIALMLASLTACAVAGWLCYRLVERPLTRWFSGRAAYVAEKNTLST
jgi:exopolysaccharide production protein ExoZ